MESNLAITLPDYAVTHLQWYAPGIGMIAILDISAENGTFGDRGELIDYYITPWSAMITPDGGTVSLPDESVSIFFPKNAVSEDVLISIVQVDEASIPPSTGGFQLLGDVYELSADGLTQFGETLTLTFHYDPELVALQQLVEEELTIYYYDELDESWIAILSEVDTVNYIVTGYTNHFTMFGIFGEVISEPTTLLLLGMGLLGILTLARRKRRKK